MAEPAWRMRNENGSDAVRRLIARPIRIDLAQSSPLGAPVAAGDETDDLDRGADAERLRAEVMVMKAVLASERRETAQLRACIGLDADDAAELLTDEARAVRDRWATLVDRLLQAPR